MRLIPMMAAAKRRPEIERTSPHNKGDAAERRYAPPLIAKALVLDQGDAQAAEAHGWIERHSGK